MEAKKIPEVAGIIMLEVFYFSYKKDFFHF